MAASVNSARGESAELGANGHTDDANARRRVGRRGGSVGEIDAMRQSAEPSIGEARGDIRLVDRRFQPQAASRDQRSGRGVTAEGENELDVRLCEDAPGSA